MKLLDYRVGDTPNLTEAVFEDTDGWYWHWQKLESPRAIGVGSGTTIQYAHLDHPPTVGVPAIDYRRWAAASSNDLRSKSLWYELMVSALRVESGWEAMAIGFPL